MSSENNSSALLLSLAVACCCCTFSQGEVTPAQLRCEYLTNPLGIDQPTPRLTWVLSSEERGARQSDFQILVASSPENLAPDQGDLWDSVQATSPETAHILIKPHPVGDLTYAEASYESIRGPIHYR